MRTVTTGRFVPYIATVLPLTVTVVLPPKYLAAYIFLLGAAAFVWGITRRKEILFTPRLLTIAVPLAFAGLFCLMGTLPVTRQADIQLEFLKYAVYGAAFLLGLLLLSQDWKQRAFILSVIALIAAFFVLTAMTSTPRFGVNQTWPLYPPDQNNSSSILAPFAALVLAFRPRWLKVGTLIVLFAFFMFAESRFGILVLIGVGIVDLLRDWRSGVIVLGAAALLAGLFSLSPVSVQTTVMQNITVWMSAKSVVQEKQPARVSKGPIVQFGTSSDNSRLKIYERALDVSIRVFPNLLGLGDARVTELLNSPPIDNFNTFQHAHNFFLQGYLAYGLLATLSLTIAAVAVLVLAVHRRDWYLVAVLVLIGAFGMIESLTSDLRVLTVLMLVIGSCVAEILRPEVAKEREQP